MLLTFFNNNNHDSNNNRNSKNNSFNIRHISLTYTTKKHVDDINKQLRDWHNYSHTRLQLQQVITTTRDHSQQSSNNSNKQIQQQQQNFYAPKSKYKKKLQSRQPQDKILNADNFGQIAITNSTYNLKLIENKQFKHANNNKQKEKNNDNSNKYDYYKKRSQLTGFNVELSESLPLQRLIPDTRHKSCKTELYPADLPSCSIIIIYHNEQATVLLRTLYTIINQTPDELLKEIILVDDFSEPNKEIDRHIESQFPELVKIIHLSQREGLIRARLKGAKEALGDVLVFLDAHVEVNENWLPPLLAPIVEDEKTCTTPIIDIIKYDTLEYQGSMPSRGGFNWQFNYVQLPLLREEKTLQPQPHNNPIMNGGLFAISQKYFWLLGGYDDGLEIWGAEQFELSFKIWLCGGRLLEVPCSRVGHLYRDPEFRVNYTSRKDDFISKNYKRVAEVWMDEYKEFLYEHIPKLNLIDAGDLKQQKLLRKQLKCKPFKWFLKNIAPDLLKAYPPVKPTDFALGAIQSLAVPKLCLDLDSVERRQILKDVLKPCSPDLKYPYASQRFHLSFRHDLRHQENCLEVQTWSSHAPIWLWPCHNLGGNQYWYYDRNTQMFVQGKTDFNQRCLDMDRDSLKIFVSYCDFGRQEQKWLIGYVNQTAMDHFFEE
ncbi:polypeptide N-acetylgalactosaminyltransferase 8 [Lucilia cuprina]|uniref:polypeptide N-acetylgalactosaminyltransferase 8 n=1 Tax=Lucilia cuprina TaxID=7375 RepID=UPI001F053F73|nr:polypeptide N-acetylgalactosaminyltransferase 8 [Lucilia cuprina]